MLTAGFALGSALALQPPTSRVLLTVSGRIKHGNAGPNRDRAEFDMAMLSALPQTQFVTSTPWFNGPRKFTGPLLRDILAVTGVAGQTLRLRALNDYRVDMPISDTQEFDVIAARLMNGQPMAVRDKGPVFIIYPFDAVQALRHTVYYTRAAWQLSQIEVI